jgi:hypothetical protein
MILDYHYFLSAVVLTVFLAARLIPLPIPGPCSLLALHL